MMLELDVERLWNQMAQMTGVNESLRLLPAVCDKCKRIQRFCNCSLPLVLFFLLIALAFDLL